METLKKFMTFTKSTTRLIWYPREPKMTKLPGKTPVPRLQLGKQKLQAINTNILQEEHSLILVPLSQEFEQDNSTTTTNQVAWKNKQLVDKTLYFH